MRLIDSGQELELSMCSPNYGAQWDNVDGQGFYGSGDGDGTFPEHLGFDQPEYQMQHNAAFQMNTGVMPPNAYPNFNNNQPGYQMNKTLFRNNSQSSIGKIDNFSHSGEDEFSEMFNRTQSDMLYPNAVNSNILTSRLNSSHESAGVFEDEEGKHTSRSYISSGSRGSNPNFTSTCARTFTSSGGVVDQNNSQMHLTHDMQNMHSSFDLGNDPNYNSYRLTPRHMSDYSYRSGQFYDPNEQFHSFHGFSQNPSNQFGAISCGGLGKTRNSFSVASLDGGLTYSSPGENFNNSSSNSTQRFNKKKSSNAENKGFRKRCPAQDEDEKLFKIDIDKIIQGEDKRTTLMIRNIPNKYSGKNLRSEVNKHHRDKYNFFYLPIDFK